MAREMKNSGVRWIGDIPSNWSVKRLKFLFSFGKGLSITKADLVEEGYPVISYGQIHSKKNSGTNVINDLIRYIPVFYTVPQSQVKLGDFIFADTSEDLEGCGNCVYIDKEVDIYAGYHTIILRRKDHEKDNKYFAYLFKSDSWRTQIRTEVNGVKLYSISQSIIKRTSLILPPLSEQKNISNFLDAKCGEIDGLLADLDAEVKTLTEYKKSVIAETVTHGIHQVATKHTGISWIGDIPSSWDLKRLQFCIKEINVKNNPIQTDFVLSLTIKDGVLPYDEKGDIGNKAKENHADYKLAFPNTIVLNSMNILIGAVGISKYFGCVSPVYYVFKNQENCDLRYINYVLSSVSFQKNLRNYAKGILEIRLRVSAFDILRQKIPVPSLEEQIEIADYLDRKCLNIETAIKDKTTQIETLKAYKSSLIYEYVTGKKQVL